MPAKDKIDVVEEARLNMLDAGVRLGEAVKALRIKDSYKSLVLTKSIQEMVWSAVTFEAVTKDAFYKKKTRTKRKTK